ncbi:hypothetical protein ILUMI_13738 [Ignelater luminosus]|uniref:Reverse transcriptase domain-containing protein n=1 Tax=Ignelater luminosus TaxID=2038154 RepID=A0A8K0D060_IGNLU|nr:hypothetical protein ILUMI_13738 [Ignelater luminosus]
MLPIHITTEMMTEVIESTQSWKTPGPDWIYNFWLKQFPSTHCYIPKQFMHFLSQPAAVLRFLTRGITFLLPKSEQFKHGSIVKHALSRLMFVDDITLLAESLQLHELLHVPEMFLKDIHMQFGMDKCKMLSIQQGKVSDMEFEVKYGQIIESLDTKPKLKNHYRAHRLSFWLNLVPDLHKPGGDDVPPSHHQLQDNDPPPPKLPSLNPRKVVTTESPSGDISKTTSSGVNSSLLATSGISDSTERVEELGGGSTTPHPVEDGFAAYSTALSVTIAIGCSLLILNVLIFAGVYYQRDKTRMNENGGQPKKRNENGQMPNNICGDLESSILGVKSDPATILGHHHSHHQLPPPEFADLPQNNATLPRPPPPPKNSKPNINTLHENQPLLHTQSIQLINTGTLTKKNTQMNSGKQNTMEELRV